LIHQLQLFKHPIISKLLFSSIGMGIPKMSALATLVVAVTHEINQSVVLIAQNVPVTLDEVFYVGS
jgi:hypothetical protein